MSVGLSDEAIISLRLPIVSKLFAELKVIQILDSFLNQFCHNITSMHIKHNQGSHQSSFQGIQIFPDNSDHSIDHFLHENLIVSQSLFGIGLFIQDGLSDSVSPLDLINQQDTLSAKREKPFLTIVRIFIRIVLESLFGHIIQTFYHHFLNFHQPNFNWTLSKHRCTEPNFLRHCLRLS